MACCRLVGFSFFAWLGALLPGAAQAPADSLAPAPPAWRRVSSRITSAGECLEILQCDSSQSVIRLFYTSGRLKSYSAFTNGQRPMGWGVATSWYEDGQLWSRQEYADGQPQRLLVYYPDGALKRRATYAGGQELVAACYDPAGQPLAYARYEQPALYPGGDALLKKDLLRRLRFSYAQRQLLGLLPAAMRTVEVLFEVGEDGSIHHPQVLAGAVPGLAAPVLSALQQLPRQFVPGRRDGEVVATYYRLPVQLGKYALVGPASYSRPLRPN